MNRKKTEKGCPRVVHMSQQEVVEESSWSETMGSHLYRVVAARRRELATCNEEERLGGKCYICCCDHRRAVMLMVLASFLLSVWFMIKRFTRRLNNDDDDGVYYHDITGSSSSSSSTSGVPIPYSDEENYGIIIAGTTIIPSACAFFGGMNFNIWLVGINLLWHVGT